MKSTNALILAIDQSTTTTKSILIDQDGKIVGAHSVPHRQYYPRDGFVEHDALELYNNTLQAIREIIAKNGVSPKRICVLSITNQRETTIIWDKDSGNPICRAPVWQCLRSKAICEDLSRKGYDKLIKEKTGYLLVPSPPAGKIKWILDNVDGARDAANSGQLLFGTVDSWLLWKLTGGTIQATDYSNASRSALFNIHTLKWDEELLDLFHIPQGLMPEVRFSDGIFGYTNAEGIFDKKIPIAGLMGDSHAALFGQNCYKEGMIKATYGTGSSIMMNIGEKPLDSSAGLVTSIGWGMKDHIAYVFEGNANFTGATMRWLIEDLGLIAGIENIEAAAASVDSSDGVYFVPAFAGLGAPYWDNDARAAISGISLRTKKANIVRAALESIAYQVKDLVDLMHDQAKINAEELRVDGGPTKNELLMQFQSDIINVPIVIQEIEDISALGSAFMAGIALGLWADKEELQAVFREKKRYHPTMAGARAEELYRGWREAVRRVLSTGG
jgi:glycerol kinase